MSESQSCNGYYDQFDKDVNIMYIPSLRSAIPRERLKVNISRSFDRKVLPDQYEKSINNTWDARVSANPRLWNGTKFRIDSVVESEASNEVTFNLGITSYKDFIGTNWSPDASLYAELGLRDHSNKQAYMSDALGVGAVVVTSDDKFILLKRSEHLGEAAGLWDIPGGHPEPKELVGMLAAEDIDTSSLQPGAVVDEIFNSTLSEIICEVNIPRECLTDPQLLGIARNTTSSGRPSSEYIVRCSLSAEEILNRYNEGTHEEADESSGILFLDVAEIPLLQQKHTELWNKLAPSAKGCLILYRLLTEK